MSIFILNKKREVYKYDNELFLRYKINETNNKNSQYYRYFKWQPIKKVFGCIYRTTREPFLLDSFGFAKVE